MTGLAAESLRTLDPSTAVADDALVPYYLVDRKLRIAVARVDGRLFAFDDLCPCAAEACPLSGGQLDGTMLMCQCHGSQFDITTGAVTRGPATTGLHLHEAHDADGRIQVRV